MLCLFKNSEEEFENLLSSVRSFIVMGKVCRVKQRTNRPKKGRGFLRHRSVSVADVSDEIPSTTDTANEGVHVNESTDNVNIVNNESNLLVNSNESPCTSVNTLNSTNLSTVSTASSIKVQQFEAHTPNSKDKGLFP